ncbi:zinc finger protein 33A-like [Artemia franciscana]|uniref:C2H2-type domain-containing protein n=1 Tax=Artemia franciscana TaxID=6661 RepID=A0AA88L7M6_ARTSF|nr:hypothetical protein QYM36_005425 [Artemia franciscana]
MSLHNSSPSKSSRILEGRKRQEEKDLKCGLCSYSSDKVSNLKRHIAIMHRNGNLNLQCCSTLFSSKSALGRHTLLAHRITHTCSDCGRLFERYTVLRRHMRMNACSRFECKECDFKSSQKIIFERHSRQHVEAQSEAATSLRNSSIPQRLNIVPEYAVSQFEGLCGGTVFCPLLGKRAMQEEQEEFIDLPKIEEVAKEDIMNADNDGKQKHLYKQNSFESLTCSSNDSAEEESNFEPNATSEPKYWLYHKKLRLSNRYQCK